MQAVIARGGRYLEAMVQGSKSEAEEGTLVCMTAGDKTLYDDCSTAFHAISKTSVFLGKLEKIFGFIFEEYM